MESLQSLNDNFNGATRDQPPYFASIDSVGVPLDQSISDVQSNYKRRYQDLLKKFRELKRDQEDTFAIHADTVIKLQDRIKEKDQLLKRAKASDRTGDAWSDSELEMNDRYFRKRIEKTRGSKLRRGSRDLSAENPPIKEQPGIEKEVSDGKIPSDQSQEAPFESVFKKQDRDDLENAKLVEILKAKIDFMKMSYEETSKYYCMLQERDKETIFQLSGQVQDLKLKLKYSANQVSVLTETSEKLKKKLKKLLDGLNGTYKAFETLKLEHDAQIQELREIYVSETQSGIEKNSKINQLQATINDKNREISILRSWLGRIKRDLRDREIAKLSHSNLTCRSGEIKPFS